MSLMVIQWHARKDWADDYFVRRMIHVGGPLVRCPLCGVQGLTYIHAQGDCWQLVVCQSCENEFVEEWVYDQALQEMAPTGFREYGE